MAAQQDGELNEGSADNQADVQKKVLKAAKNGNKKVLQTYLKSLSDIKFQDCDGRSPLHWVVESTTATTEAKVDIIKILVKAGVEINSVDLNGWTALLSASSIGNLEVCSALLKLSADGRLANEDGSTALHYFVRHFFEQDEKTLREVIELFQKRGANINAKNKFDETPLHLTCIQGDDRLVRILIENGAAMNLWDLKGQTPLHCAVRCNRVVPCQILVGFEASFELRHSEHEPSAKELAESLNLINILRLFYAKDSTEYSLNILVNEEEDYLVFMEYLKTEFSTENLEFWSKTRSYRLITDELKRDQEAKAIYTEYILTEDVINIRGVAKKEIMTTYEQCNGRRYPQDLFDGAAVDVWLNMRDSYYRFMKTKQFQDLEQNFKKRLLSISKQASEKSPRLRSPRRKGSLWFFS